MMLIIPRAARRLRSHLVHLHLDARILRLPSCLPAFPTRNLQLLGSPVSLHQPTPSGFASPTVVDRAGFPHPSLIAVLDECAGPVPVPSTPPPRVVLTLKLPSGLESLTVIWWLCTWAVLASEASVSTRGLPLSFFPKYFRTATDCIKASAGLGALVWLLFLATLAFLGMSPGPAAQRHLYELFSSCAITMVP